MDVVESLVFDGHQAGLTEIGKDPGLFEVLDDQIRNLIERRCFVSRFHGNDP